VEQFHGPMEQLHEALEQVQRLMEQLQNGLEKLHGALKELSMNMEGIHPLKYVIHNVLEDIQSSKEIKHTSKFLPAIHDQNPDMLKLLSEIDAVITYLRGMDLNVISGFNFKPLKRSNVRKGCIQALRKFSVKSAISKESMLFIPG
jgi:hypothetical protein